MALHRFTGLVATVFPFDRDAQGQPLGEVQPGDERDLDKALDWQWVPVEPGGDGSGGDGSPDAGTGTPDQDAADAGTPAPEAASEPAAASPVPAPPAVVPPGGAFAVTADQQ